VRRQLDVAPAEDVLHVAHREQDDQRRGERRGERDAEESREHREHELGDEGEFRWQVRPLAVDEGTEGDALGDLHADVQQRDSSTPAVFAAAVRAQCWVVERTRCWIDRLGAPRVRRQQKTANHDGALRLACVHVTLARASLLG
jgi:hypothetical protein